MKTIGNKIKELRRSKGMSQKDIADKLGVTSQAVSKWENDGSLPEMTMLPDIASLFGIQIDDLFEYSTEKRYESIEKKLQYGRVMTNMEFENEEAFLIREVEADPTNYMQFLCLETFTDTGQNVCTKSQCITQSGQLIYTQTRRAISTTSITEIMENGLTGIQLIIRS